MAPGPTTVMDVLPFDSVGRGVPGFRGPYRGQKRFPAGVTLAAALLVSCSESSGRRDVSVLDMSDAPRVLSNDQRLLVTVTDSVRGEGLPCKLTVRGALGTPSPSWGQHEQIGEWLDLKNWALGIGQWVLMAQGRAEIVLPPGHYELTVTRGTEYAGLSLGTVDIRLDRGAEVSGTLRRVVDTAGEIAGDFHVHSAPSFDSDVPMDQRVISLAVEGIEVFASTDHDASGDFAPVISALDLGRHIHWVKGDEITADGFGHFGAFPLPEDLDPAVELTHDEPSVARIIARARAVAPSAVIQLNHPLWRTHPIGYWSIAGFDPTTGHASTELYTQFDAVEVWNGHTLDEDDPAFVPVDGVIDAWMATLQLARGATATGNSDTHRLAHSPPGWPRTYLRVPDDDPARVTDAMITSAITAGDASLTSGPFLRATVHGLRPGQLVRNAGRQVTVHVDLQAPLWTPADRIEVIVNRKVVAARDVTIPAEGTARQQAWDISIELTRDAWVVVRTRAIETVPDMAGVHRRRLPSLAMVNPIYLDVDRDGTWSPPGINGGP
jgi:hypothetical protein